MIDFAFIADNISDKCKRSFSSLTVFRHSPRLYRVSTKFQPHCGVALSTPHLKRAHGGIRNFRSDGWIKVFRPVC